ncbi:MAG: cytochrome c oxidase subunit 3 family protein [Myxococcales bacterium]|nr:MAG: cytochrome c oxidase subunit 3 family protein [Myxococcales bacterium]
MANTTTGSHSDEHHEHPSFLQHHFDTPAQQFDAAKLGMWLFLAQEVLFFSGLFVAYFVFRAWYPDAFAAGSRQLDTFWGTANTGVLLFSSLTAALAVRSAQLGQKNRTSVFLIITVLCACTFMVVKYFEYAHKFHLGLLPGKYFNPQHLHDGVVLPAETGIFFGLYFIMTGVHGLHVLIGIGVIIWILIRNIRGEFSERYFTPVDITALYWHLVDLVWIYLFPLLYLME